MLKLLQRSTNAVDENGNLVSTAELWLQNFILSARAARYSHGMVVSSRAWHSTPEALDFWVNDALRWRAKTAHYAFRYREACAKEARNG
jgi:hypothetical protein